MKKLITASILTVGLSISVMAADLVPTDTKGSVTLPDYAGVSTCVISNSTSTNAVLCDSGAGIILDILVSSVTSTTQVVFRDSATANTSSTVLGAVDASHIPTRVLPRYKNGLSVNASPAIDAGTGRLTIIYRALD